MCNITLYATMYMQVFKDLSGVTCGSNIPLVIDKNAVLGKGGSALVLKGELCNPVSI